MDHPCEQVYFTRKSKSYTKIYQSTPCFSNIHRKIKKTEVSGRYFELITNKVNIWRKLLSINVCLKQKGYINIILALDEGEC
jgi:hypothetical protein